MSSKSSPAAMGAAVRIIDLERPVEEPVTDVRGGMAAPAGDPRPASGLLAAGGARLYVRTAPGAGTTLRLEVPRP